MTRKTDDDNNFQRVAAVEDIGGEQPLIVGVDGRRLVLVRLGDEILCIDNRCPHAGGRLGEGDITDCQIRCPRHGYKFDLRSGRCISDPRFEVERFAIRVEQGEVYVKLSTTSNRDEP